MGHRYVFVKLCHLRLERQSTKSAAVSMLDDVFQTNKRENRFLVHRPDTSQSDSGHFFILQEGDLYSAADLEISSQYLTWIPKQNIISKKSLILFAMIDYQGHLFSTCFWHELKEWLQDRHDIIWDVSYICYFLGRMINGKRHDKITD